MNSFNEIIQQTHTVEGDSENSTLPSPRKHRRAVILTVNTIEEDEVFSAFQEKNSAVSYKTIKRRRYRWLGIHGDFEVFHTSSEMGSMMRGASLMMASTVIEDLKPDVIIAVGIAFGANKHEQKIGDVLISKQLLSYEPRRVSDDEERDVLRGDRVGASEELLHIAHSIDAENRNNTPNWPKLHFGLIVSGEKLIDSETFKDEIIKKAGGEAIGGEMEGAGIYAAAQDKNVKWIIVKGICDWAVKKGQNKKNRQKFAACNAAFVAKKILHPEAALLEWRQLHGEPTSTPYKTIPNEMHLSFATLWWFICGVLPISTLYFAFGKEGQFFAQLYPHFFLYQLLIGFFVALCIVPPIHFLFYLLPKKKLFFTLTICALIAAFGTFVDVKTGDPAMWEYNDIHEFNYTIIPIQDTRSENVHALIEAHKIIKNCKQIAFFSLSKPVKLVTDKLEECDLRRTALKNFMHEQLTKTLPDFSIPHYTYVLSLFVQIMTLALSASCIVNILTHKIRNPDESIYGMNGKLALTFCFYFLWLPVRIYALEIKYNLYDEWTLISEIPIIIVVIACYCFSIFLTHLTERGYWLKKYAFQIIQALIGIVLIYISVINNQLVSLLIGVKSEPWSYPIIPAVLLIFVWPFLWIADTNDNSD